jgi:hypothetical protein
VDENGRITAASNGTSGAAGTVTSVATGTGLTGGPITTSGTISIDAGGVDTTQLANGAVTTDKIDLRAVTFEKVQLVSNMTVLGNVSGGVASPSSVTILDEDAMTSNSATALATQQSIKAYVDSQAVSKYSTGWFNNSTGLTNGGTYTFTHGLGSADLTFTAFASTTGSDSNQVQVNMIEIIANLNTYGCGITALSTTGFTLQLASGGFNYLQSNGAHATGNWSSYYVKIVAVG